MTLCRGAAWEDNFLDTVGYYEESGYFKHISIARFASRTLDHELEKNTRTVIPYFSSTFILMAIFRWVSSTPWSISASSTTFSLSQYNYVHDGRHRSVKAMAWTFGKYQCRDGYCSRFWSRDVHENWLYRYQPGSAVPDDWWVCGISHYDF